MRFQKESEIRGTLEGRLAGEFPKQTIKKTNVFLFFRCILVCVCVCLKQVLQLLHRMQTSVWAVFGCVGSQLSAECGLILMSL